MSFRVLHFAGWITAGVLFQAAEPGIPVLWAMAGALVFGISLALMALVSPYIVNRAMMAVQREASESTRFRLDRLDSENEVLKQKIEALQTQNLVLRKRNDELEFDLTVAHERIVELESPDS